MFFQNIEFKEEQPILEDIFMSFQDHIDNSDVLSLVNQGIEKKSGNSVNTENLTKKVWQLHRS